MEELPEMTALMKKWGGWQAREISLSCPEAITAIVRADMITDNREHGAPLYGRESIVGTSGGLGHPIIP